MLLVGGDGVAEGPEIRALRAVRLPILVAAVDNYGDALGFLRREGSFSDLNNQSPTLVLIAPSQKGPELTDFLCSARKSMESRTSPIVLLLNEADDCALSDWYLCGVNSVVATEGAELSACIEEICLYWLVHNRTPNWTE